MKLAPDQLFVLDTLGDPIVVADLEDRIVRANPAAERLLGWPPGALAGRPLPEIMPARFHRAHLEGFRRWVATRAPKVMGRPIRVAALRRDGTEVEVELLLSPFPGDLIVATFRDLRDRVELERQGELLALLEMVFDAAPVAIGFLDRELRFVRVNEAWADVDGRTPADLVGRTVREIALERADLVEPVYRSVLESGKPRLNEEVSGVGVGTAGIRRSWLVSRYPLRDRAGAIVGIGVIGSEVTAQRQAAAALERSEQLRRAITDTASVGLLLVDERRRCTFMNPAAERITGFTFDEVAGRDAPLHDIVHHTRPDGRPYPLEECPLHRALPERRLERGEEVLVRRDGAFCPVAFTISPLVEGGEKVGSVVEIRDITEEIRAREERERVAGRHRFLAEATAAFAGSLELETILNEVAHLAVPRIADACSIRLVREDGSIDRVALAHVDPVRERELLGLAAGQPADPKLPFGSDHTLRTGEPQLVESVSEVMLLAAIRIFPRFEEALRALGALSSVSVALRSRTGGTLGVIAFVTTKDSGRHLTPADLAFAQEFAVRASFAVENARLYRAAQEAVRVRDEFLSIASHELKTPLTPLQLQILSLLRRTAEVAKESKQEWLEGRLRAVFRQSERLNRLVVELLDLSRIVGHRLELDLEPVDLGEVAREVLATFEELGEMDRSGSKVRLSVPEGIVGRWDRMRLVQIVTNLLSNALKFGAGKPVSVTGAADGDAAALEVTDLGIGIAPADCERIFGRFERAASARHYGGLGLGLYIVRQIVEALGGTIQVRSTPGEGSTFRVTLPLAGPPPTTVPPGSLPETGREEAPAVE